MAQLTVKTRSGEIRTFEVPRDQTVMEAIRENGIGELLALCGGTCSCATCHVYVDGDATDGLSAISEDEDGLLEGTLHRKPTSRLSCQLRIPPSLSALQVTIAPED